VLLFVKDMIEVVQELKSCQELRLGEKLATRLAHN
ncbi:phosphatidylserine decarboxylase, partial [Bacillus cereus]|nr:phosphatidylserine decarboxylase [Bacillus cereus]